MLLTNDRQISVSCRICLVAVLYLLENLYRAARIAGIDCSVLRILDITFMPKNCRFGAISIG